MHRALLRMPLTRAKDLQKRFIELQSLLVKYQTNGRTPSPKKTVKSPLTGDKPAQVCDIMNSMWQTDQ